MRLSQSIDRSISNLCNQSAHQSINQFYLPQKFTDKEMKQETGKEAQKATKNHDDAYNLDFLVMKIVGYNN